MSLQHELNFPNAIEPRAHEAALNVVFTASMLIREAYSLLRPFGLTDSQFNVLRLLRHQAGPEGTINQTRMGQMLLVNRSNVTGLIDRMEAAGWVERIDDPEDRRIKLVQLTPVGRRLVDQVNLRYEKRVTEVMGELTASEQSDLCALLEKVRRRLISGKEA